MPDRSFARPTVMVIVAAALAACSSSTTTTSSAPAPSPAPSTTAAAAPASGALPSGVTMAMVATGDSIFHARACKNCHGPSAAGAQNGPSLLGPTFLHVNGTYEDYVRVITNGIPADSIKDSSHRFPMAPRGGARPAPLTDEQIRDVAAYVYSLSHK